MTTQDRRAAEEIATEDFPVWWSTERCRSCHINRIFAALQKAREEERERCAKVAERHVPSSPSAAGEYAMRHNGQDIAAAIRALLESEG